ncbi:MAG: MBL fold metallo-hydrolase RNA specificity domain-containing protein [Candidatus Hydrogenedentota bacterium]
MQITSYGAAQEVTGSKHLVECGGSRVLLDCGMFQGIRTEADRKNRELGVDPFAIHTTLLSHAHIDHSGLLPLLSKRGYHNPIYATPATRDLCSIMLLDSAHIQRRDAEWLSKKHQSFVPPLYTTEDVQEVMRRFAAVPYGLKLPVAPDVYATFQEAGHVLGSAMIMLESLKNGKRQRLLYTGDIGRRNMPILADPWTPEPADVVIMESTYGNRDHRPIQEMDARLADIVRKTVERGGKIIIPSFALERAQEVVYALKRLEMEDAIPEVPVFVDSPLTVNITEVFRLHTESFDKEFCETMREAGDPFQLREIHYIRNVEESKRLNNRKGPAIIISAAGMCEHGRILHHLKNNCSDPNNTILIIGFQAQHTLGRRIVERDRHIKVFGMKYELNAEVRIMNEFSAHAGRAELIEFGTQMKDKAGHFLLVHGEEEAQAALKTALEEAGVANVHIQQPGAPFTV